jgi:MinD-like ATPase involved in chromosome partitioning or flagellar assembly
MKKAWQLSAPKQAPSATDWVAVDIPSSGPQKEMARVIVVASVKGGEGKTSFLAQLGMVLAKKGYRPLGIDADPAGNLARWIGRDTVNDISEFANEKTRVNRENLEMMLVQHQKTGFKVLPSPLRGLHPVTWEMAEAAVRAYKPYYPLMLVDLAEGYTPVFEQLAKNYATDIFLVTSTDMTRVERTREMAAKMLERGIPRDKVHVVVNKVRKESDFHVVRASLSELGFSVYPVPFHPGLAEAGEVGLAPAITDPKSAYAKAFKKVLMDELRVKIGPSGQPSAKKRSKKAGEKRKSGFSLERWFPRFLTRKRGEEV